MTVARSYNGISSGFCIGFSYGFSNGFDFELILDWVDFELGL